MSAKATAGTQHRMGEHVLLESDDVEDAGVPGFGDAGKVQAQLHLHSRIRAARLSMRVFDYRYLAVRTQRRWSSPGEFVLDLRFIDPAPLHARQVPVRWWQVTAGLVLLCALAAGYLAASPSNWWQNDWVPEIAALYCVTACIALISSYLTTQTWVLQSRHGHARLVVFVGGVGTFRALRAFEAKLAAHVRHAIAARGQTKAQHLRSEMREHQRLRDLGVLAAADYEDSKLRILRSHD